LRRPEAIGLQVTPLFDIVKRRSIRASAFDTRVRIEARQGFRVVDQDEVTRNLVGGLDRTPSERSRSKLVFLNAMPVGRDPGGVSLNKESRWVIPMGIDNESDQVP